LIQFPDDSGSNGAGLSCMRMERNPFIGKIISPCIFVAGCSDPGSPH
jgi:hypothetical protein